MYFRLSRWCELSHNEFWKGNHWCAHARDVHRHDFGVGRASDSINSITWDEEAQRYLLYTRTDFGTLDGWREIRGTRVEMTDPNLFPSGACSF